MNLNYEPTSRQLAARVLVDALFEEIPDGAPKTDHQLAIEAFLWRQMDMPELERIMTEAITP